METTYEKIELNKLPFEVTSQFELNKLPDNSILLIRYGQDLRTVEAVVMVIRTSINHYTITGCTQQKGSKTGYGKTFAEVAVFIKRWFCRTLLD